MPEGKLPSLLIPDISWCAVRRASLLAFVGSLAAGGFGIVHDQITYTISPEYFTQMKFDQFRSADFGFPDRILVAEIGFLATWWVGLIAAWFLARIAIPRFVNPEKQVFRALLAIMGITLLCGLLGFFLGPIFFADNPLWVDAMDSMGIKDPHAFHQVSGIHLGSYAGAILGWLVWMGVFLRTSSAHPFAGVCNPEDGPESR